MEYSNKRLPGACNRSPGSKLLSITTQLHCGGHLGGRPSLPDTIFECEFPIGPYVKLSTAVQPSWSEGRTTRHNFGRGSSNDYFIKVWFQTRRFLCEFPIGSYVKLSSAVSAILVEGPNHRTHFWKRTIQ